MTRAEYQCEHCERWVTAPHDCPRVNDAFERFDKGDLGALSDEDVKIMVGILGFGLLVFAFAPAPTRRRLIEQARLAWERAQRGLEDGDDDGGDGADST